MVEVEFRSNNGPIWSSRHTREWRAFPIRENEISLNESEQNIRVVESVLGEGDEFTVIGHLTAPHAHVPSSYRTVAPAPRELGVAELLMPFSLDDLRRLAADREERTRLLTTGIFVGIGLFIAGVLMPRG